MWAPGRLPQSWSPPQLQHSSRPRGAHVAALGAHRAPLASAAPASGAAGAGAPAASGSTSSSVVRVGHLGADNAAHQEHGSRRDGFLERDSDSPPTQVAGQRATQPAPAAAAAARQLRSPRLHGAAVPSPDKLPRHLAVIMDGNSRWAAARGLPAAVGYRRGVEALRSVVRCCHAWGVPCLTVYAFSSENWRRAPAEVAALLALMERVLAAEVAELATAGVRLSFMGDLDQLPASLRRQIRSAEQATAAGSHLHLNVAISYSGRQDLTRAAQEIARLAAAGQLRPEDVTPELLEGQLATCQLPPAWRHPDLVVRSGGEQRLSNFLLWEAAYSELHFSGLMWPDFGEEQLAEALSDYARRERRFGGRHHSAGGSGSGGSAGAGGSGSGGGSSGGGVSGGCGGGSGSSRGGVS